MDRSGRNLIRIRGLDHVVIRSKNPEALLPFYCDLLGCVVERELPPDVGLVQLRAGSALIDLVAVDSELGRLGGAAPGSEGHNVDHFCLEIDPVDELDLLKWLERNGIETGSFARRYGANGFGRTVYIKDPDGNTVELKLGAES